MGTFDNIVSSAKNFACGIYKDQPGALIPNPISDLLYAAWDNLCDYPGSPGLPPPPSRSFSGGQCLNVVYRVDFTIVSSEGNASDLASVFGPVGGTRARLEPDGINRVRAFYEILCNGQKTAFFGSPRPYDWYSVGQNPGMPLDTNLRVDAVTRIDNLPDNCGDLPTSFPPGGSVPPGGFTSLPVPIPLGNGDSITVNFNFSPPQSPPLGDLIPPIVINYIKPEVNIKVPIEFNFNGEVNFGNPSGKSPDTDKIDNISDDLTNLKDKFEEFKDNFDDFKNEQDKDEKREDNEPDEEADRFRNPSRKLPGRHDVARLAYVEVILEIVPLNAKKQLADDGTEILYAGWFGFLKADNRLERMPIHHRNNIFFAPPEVTGYTFTLYEGYIGYAIEVTNIAG